MPSLPSIKSQEVASLCIALVAALSVGPAARAVDYSYGDSTNAFTLTASDHARAVGGALGTFGDNGWGSVFDRGTERDATYMHIDLSPLAGRTLSGSVSLNLVAWAQWGGAINNGLVATANGAWSYPGATPGYTAISDSALLTGNYATGEAVTWTISEASAQALLNSPGAYHGLVVTAGAASQAHFNAPATLTGVSAGTDIRITGATDWSAAAFDNGTRTLSITGSADGVGGNVQITPGATLSVTDTATLGAGSFDGSFVSGGTLSFGSSTHQALTGVISSSGQIVKSGTGTLTLCGTNSYSGLTEIQAGMLVASNSTALGRGGWNSIALTYIRDGATLALQGGVSLDEHMHLQGAGVGGLGALRSLSGNNALTMTSGGGGSGPGFGLDGHAIVGVDADSLTVSGFYHDSGSYGITKVGAGTLVFTKISTYAGGTTVSNGVLELTGATGGSGLIRGTVTVASGATLAITSGDGTGFGWNNAISSLTVDGGTVNAAGGSHIGFGTAATVAVTNGGIIAGSWQWNGDGLLSFNSSGDSTSVISGSLVLRSDAGANHSFNVGDGASVTDLLVTATLADQYPDTWWVPASILVKNGAGLLSLSAINTYDGGTVVNGGVLEVTGQNGGEGCIRGTVTVNAGAELRARGSSGAIFGYADQRISVLNISSGLVSSVGGPNHLWNATVNMTAGELRVNGGVSDPNGDFYEWGNTALNTLAASDTALVSGRIRIRADANAALTFTTQDGVAATDLLVTASLTQENGACGIVKTGPGTMALTGTNTYSGVTVLSGGVLNVSSLSNYGVTGPLGNRASDPGGEDVGLLFRGGTLQYTGATPQSTDRAIRLSTTGGGATLDASGAPESATLSFTAATSPNFFENPGNRTLALTGSNTGSNVFAMAIQEAGGQTSLTKSGPGKWVLAGANTYTGPTLISGGTLGVGAGSTVAGSTSITVAAGATLDVSAGGLTVGSGKTLKGDGTVVGAVTADSGAIILPGDTAVTGSRGTLAITGGATFSGGSMRYDLGASPAGTNDLLTISGQATLSADVTVTLRFAEGALGTGTYTIVTWGSSTGTGVFKLAEPYRGVSVSQDGAGVYLNVSAGGGPAALTWAGDGTSNTWDIATTTNWLAGALPDRYYDQDAVTFDDGGSTSPDVNLTTTLRPASLVVNTAIRNYIFGGAGTLAGDIGLTKSGASMLTMKITSGLTNVTTVAGGTLSYRSNYSSASHVIAGGAMLELDTTDGDRDYAATTFTGGGTLRKVGGNSAIWGPARAVFALSSGALIDVRAGLFIGGSYANEDWTANKSDLNVEAGATFSGVEANVRVDALSGSGTIMSGYPGAGYTYFSIGVDNGSGIFGGSLADGNAAGNLAKDGLGTQTLTGTNRYTGWTSVNRGMLALAGSGVLGPASGLAVGGDGTFRIQDTASGSFNDLNIGSWDGGAGNVEQSGGTLTVTGTSGENAAIRVGHWPNETSYYRLSGGTLRITAAGGNVALGTDGTGYFVQTGGQLETAGIAVNQRSAMGYGGFTLQGGTVNIGTNGIFSDGGACEVNLGGGTVGSLGPWSSALAMLLTGSGGDVAFDTTGGAIALSGTLSGPGGLRKVGTGTLTLSGANAYRSDTVITNGTLSVSSAASLSGVSVLHLETGAVLDLNYTGTAVVPALFIAGVPKAPGLYTVAQLGTGFTGTGQLLIGDKRLLHRWSFNGNLVDSVGGSDAVIVEVGANDTTLSTNQVTMTGGSRDASDYIKLGANLLPDANAAYTIELWATPLSLKNWSRIFDFGSSTAEYLFMSWSQATDENLDRVEWVDGGGATADSTCAPYSLGVEFHIAMVIEPGAGTGGKTRVSWYKAASSGLTIGAARGSFETANLPSALSEAEDNLGRSFYGDDTANASYNEVRLWLGARTQAELEKSHFWGPDKLAAPLPPGIVIQVR